MKRFLIASSVALAITFSGVLTERRVAAHDPPFEVWLLDQAQSDDTDHDGDGKTDDGGFLYVWTGRPGGGLISPPLKIDLTEAASHALDHGVPAAFPVGRRPHILGHNADGTHVAINFIGPDAPNAGVLFMRTADKQAVGWVGGLTGIHMPGPSPDDAILAGVSTSQRKLHLISTDYATETFALIATVDLLTLRQDPSVPGSAGQTLPELLSAGWTGAPPNGTLPPTPRKADGTLDVSAFAAAQCNNWTPDNKYNFLTFATGGLAVIQLREEAPDGTLQLVDGDPITAGIQFAPRLLEVYSADEIPGEGCGLLQHPDGDRTYTSGASKAFDQEYVYAWSMLELGDGARMGDGLKNDLLASIPLYRDGEIFGRGDSHGPMFTKQGQYMWIAMRLDNTIRVIDTAAQTTVNAFVVAPGNVAPDVIDTNHLQNRMFVTLRGFCPLTALQAFVDDSASRICPSPPAPPKFLLDGSLNPARIESDGRKPGMAVLEVSPDGISGTLLNIRRLNNIIYDDSQPIDQLNVVDPHGLKVVPAGGILP